MMKTVLLTGAAGIVGTALRPFLAKRYGRLLLTDIKEITGLAANELFERGDITDIGFVKDLARRAEGIVHLAGNVGPEYTFGEVLGPNIVGAYNVFEAARQAGVRQVVYASSHHAVGFLPRGAVIDESTPPRPDSWYGVSKVFGEAVGSYYADKYGLNVLAIRIGSVTDKVQDERRLRLWSSPRDLARLIEIGLAAEDLGWRLVYGVSQCPDPFFQNSEAERLGYRARDRAEDFPARESILTERPGAATVEGRFVGGHFAAEDYQNK